METRRIVVGFTQDYIVMHLNWFFERVRTRLREGLIRVGYYSRPAFLIIGAQKCGTSALHKYLSLHPNIVPAQKKEICFFSHDIRFNRGTTWYHSHFPLPHRLGQKAITFEACPSYVYYPNCAWRIFSYDSRIKLLALLRDPVERAYSSWKMYRFFHRNPSTLLAEAHNCDQPIREWVDEMLSGDSFHEFDEAVRDEIDKVLFGHSSLVPHYVRAGIYCDQLLRYYKYFDRSQVFVVDSFSLRSNTPGVLSDITKFLELPAYDWLSIELPLVNVRESEQMPDGPRRLLREFYKPYNEKLYELVGRDFGWQ